MPVRARKLASSLSPGSLPRAQSIAWSPTRTRPRSGNSSKLMQRSSVDLPEPDGPIRATAEPFGTSSDMPFSTCSGPKAFQRSLPSIIVSLGAALIASVRSLQAPLHQLGAKRQGKEDGEIDQRHGGVGLERAIGGRGYQLTLIEQIGNRDRRYKRGILELDDRLIDERRGNSLDLFGRGVTR